MNDGVQGSLDQLGDCSGRNRRKALRSRSLKDVRERSGQREISFGSPEVGCRWGDEDLVRWESRCSAGILVKGRAAAANQTSS